MGDKIDYSFMKTGENLVNSDEIDETVIDMASIMTLFTKKGLENSECYVKHCKRPSITPEDIKRGMIIEMFFFSKRPGLFPEVQEVKESLMADDDEDEDEDFVSPAVEDNTPFSESTCPCSMCRAMNGIYLKWNSFQPSSVIEDILYRNINKVPT